MSDTYHGQVPGWGAVQTRLVYPDEARELLKLNTHNRPLQLARVREFAEMIRRGEWRNVGDIIDISDQNVLLNGQHRLSAIVMANLPAILNLRFGVPTELQSVTDQGPRRSLGNALSLEGERHGNILAGAANWLYGHTTGRLTWVSRPRPLTVPRVHEVLADWPDLRDAVEYTMEQHGNLQGGLPTSAMAALVVQARRVDDPEHADEFAQQVLRGDRLSGPKDPRFVLRERLLANQRSPRKEPAQCLYGMAVKAWNLWRSHKPCGRLLWRPDQRFPTVLGPDETLPEEDL